jgi:hypothetical protein
LAALVLICFCGSPARAQSELDAIRRNVRTGPDPSPAVAPKEVRHDDRPTHEDDFEIDDDGSLLLGGAVVAAFVVASPFWAPVTAAGDDYGRPMYFQRFPYDDERGYMVLGTTAVPPGWSDGESAEGEELTWLATDWIRTRPWSCRLRAEYADGFGDRSRIGGHVLLSHTSRFGLDSGVDYLRETRPGGGHDHLSLGDFNIVFRFAQNERVQFRTGLGFNWLDDEFDTDFGFNFTYGADLFPCRPWVVSATLDWGTLDQARLFRFRSTAGVVFHGIEAYTGYEYLDIGSTHMNELIGGVRIWL